MTDQTPAPRTIAADKVQAVADWLWEEEMANGGLDEMIAPQLAARAQMCWEARAKLQALLRPTLADMTPEERAACIRMQCDTEGWGRVVILNPHPNGGNVILVDDRGTVIPENPARVTPRPDLPRLEWPGDQKPEPAPAPALPDGWRLADHQKYGRVIVTNPTPNRDGYVYCVFFSGRDGTGFDWNFCGPDELTYIDTGQGADQ